MLRDEADLLKLLEGVRVVESAQLLNGDLLGMHLAFLGAEVIKVEDPARGDYLREILGTIAPGNSLPHLQCNAGKRSVAVDLRDSDGIDIFWRLIECADVFIDGNRGGVCDRLGIGYAEQQKHQPKIIYCHHTAYGSQGPYAKLPAHGLSMNALAGDAPVAMDGEGFMRPASPDDTVPRKGPDATIAGALWGAYCVAAALVRRSIVGAGALIDISAADAVVALTGLANVYCLNRGRIADPSTLPAFSPSGELTGAKYQNYETRDGHAVLLAAMEPKFWRSFCGAIARDDLLSAGDSGSIMDFAQDDDLRRELQQIFHGRTRAEWMKLAVDLELAIVPVTGDVTELLDNPQVRGRNLFLQSSHPDAGPFTILGVPAMVDSDRFDDVRPAPRHGEHTMEILGELGYTETTCGELRKRNVIRDGSRSQNGQEALAAEPHP